MNRCLRTCFIFMLENKRVKETHLVLELKAACLWSKLSEEAWFPAGCLKVAAKNTLHQLHLLRQNVYMYVFEGEGGIKPLGRVYCRSERKETTVGLKWVSWMVVWFVTGSALCYWTFLSHGHLRCFLCLNLPGLLHVLSWKPYELTYYIFTH